MIRNLSYFTPLRIKTKIMLSLMICLFIGETPIARSTQSDQEKNPSAQEKSNLNLPDVIIYGTERTIRQSGNKLTVRDEPIQLVHHHLDYGSAMSSNVKLQDKEMPGATPKLPPSETLISLLYGSFNSSNMNAAHWQRLNQSFIRIHGDYHHSDGQFSNSKITAGNGGIHLGMRIKPQFLLLTQGELTHTEYGLHGASILNLKRKSTCANAKIQSQWTYPANGSTTLEVMYRKASFQDHSAPSQYKSDLEDQTVGIATTHKRSIFSASQLILGIDYWQNNYSPHDRTFQIFQLTTKFTLPISRYFTLNPAIAYEKATSYHGQLLPSLTILFTPNRRFGFALKGSRYFQPFYLYDLWRINNYVGGFTTLKPMLVHIDIEGDMEFHLTASMILRAKASRMWIKQYAFWQRIQSSGLFQLDRFSEVVVNRFMIGITYDWTAHLTLSSDLIYSTPELKDDSYAVKDNGVPYFTKLHLPATLQIKPFPSTWFTIRGELVGNRRTSITSTTELDRYVLVSIKAEKGVGSYVTFFIEAENLLNDEYEIWEGYQEKGIYLFIGLRSRW